MALSVQWGMQEAGITATLVPYTDWLPKIDFSTIRGVGTVSKVVSSIGRPYAEMKLIRALEQTKPDLVLFIKCDDIHRLTYREIRRRLKVPLAAFHPDDPFNRSFLFLPAAAPRRSLTQIREVDVYFHWTRRIVERASRLGAKRARYISFAYDPSLHPRISRLTTDQIQTYGAEAAFIGGWDRERERCLGPLAESGIDLAIWGPGYWRTRCGNEALRRAYRGRALLGHEQAIAVAATSVNINILRLQNKNSCNMRTFEIPGMAGFMLHEHSEEAADYFPRNIACGYFDSPTGLVEQARYWLDHSEERRRVAEEGYRAATAWTYREWSSVLMDHLIDAIC
jgi:hypothetical protein